MTNAMKKKESSAAAVVSFEGVAADLAGAGVVLGQTFGARALVVNRKAIACLNGDEMAFKLGRDSPGPPWRSPQPSGPPPCTAGKSIGRSNE
ncbi:hypothetical protein [Arthrobacter sp. UYCu712]|uniref:hypothetical protein n=1 Tax=Arthrobacter sp. UYCu712 TaxID=3156340 RepID=UPI003396CB54